MDNNDKIGLVDWHVEGIKKERDELRRQLMEARKERDDLRAALAFYADPTNWQWNEQPDGDDVRVTCAAGLDQGERARRVLGEG